MTAAEKIDMVIEATPQMTLDHPEFEIHISPLIYFELVAQNQIVGQKRERIKTYRGHKLVVHGPAMQDRITAQIKSPTQAEIKKMQDIWNFFNDAQKNHEDYLHVSQETYDSLKREFEK